MALDNEALEMLGELPSDVTAPRGEDVALTGGSDGGLVGGAYDGARRADRAMALWQPRLRSADNDILPEKQTVDARTRDALRNDAYVAAGATLHKDNIVGSLYALNSKPAIKVLGQGFDETWETEFQEEVEERFTLWAESPDAWIDAARRNTFTELVRLAVGINTAGGELLAAVEWLRDFGRPYSTAIQFIDTDRLSTPPTLATNPDIIAGVEVNQYGAPIAHHIRLAHPSDWRKNPDNYRWKRVPIRKPWGRLQMIHIMEQDRPAQTRGITAMVSALKEIRMTKNWRDVTLQNAVVNATYAAAIESELPSADVFASLGGVGMDNVAEGLEQYIAGYLGQIAQYSTAAKNLMIDGVKIPHLYPGTKLNMLPAGKGGPLGQEFEKSLLRYIASALGVSYEQLSRDFSSTNYSSARAAMAETWKRMGSVKRIVADRFATYIFRLWLEEAVNKGMIESLPNVAKRRGWLYEAQRLDALSRCEWIGASKGQIDELKETQAAILRLRHGLSTLEIEAGRLGQDWRTLTRQQKREMETREAAGLPSAVQDNTVNAISGDPRESNADSGSANDNTGDQNAE